MKSIRRMIPILLCTAISLSIPKRLSADGCASGTCPLSQQPIEAYSENAYQANPVDQGCTAGTCPLAQSNLAPQPTTPPPCAAQHEPCTAYHEARATFNYAPLLALSTIAIITVVTILIQDEHHNHHGHN